MTTLAIALSLVGYGLAARRRFAWPSEAIPLTLAALVIDVLYVAGLAGALRAGAYTLVAGGVALGALEIAARRRAPSEPGGLSPGVAIFVALAALFAWRLQGGALVGWDEFSHWGLTSKTILETHALVARDSAVLVKDYPPGTALFHYLLTLGRGYSETGAYVAHTILALAAITALTVGSRVPAALATFVFGYFGVFLFARGFQALEVDHIVGLFFGCGLGSYVVSRDSGRVARLIPVVMALPLLKHVGLMLAVFIALTVATDQWLSGRRAPRQLAALLLLAAAPWLVSATWRAHVRTLGVSPTFALPLSVERVANSFSSDRSSERDRVTIAAFRAALGSTAVTGTRLGTRTDSLSDRYAPAEWSLTAASVRTWAWILVVVAGLAIAIQPDAGAVTRAGAGALWLAASGTCYAFGLLVLYLYSFAEYEAQHLASFGRYFGILFLGIACSLFAWTRRATGSPGLRGGLGAGLLAVLAAGTVIAAPADAVDFWWKGPQRLTPAREDVQRALQPVLQRTGPGDRVYLVWQGTIGFEFFTSRYEIAPRTTNLFCWSLGAVPRFEGDIWTCPVSSAELATRLEDFDYILVADADEPFWQEYGALFDGEGSEILYAVEKSPALRLVPAR